MSDERRPEVPWENTGARFRLDDGREVGQGDVFEASASDPDVIRRRHKLVPAMVGYTVTVPSLDEAGDAEDDEAPETPEEPVETEAPVHPFAGIDFGSDQAYELARAKDMTAADFEGRTGTGEEGAFVKPDVQAILDSRDDGGD